MDSSHVDALAQKICDYHRLDHELEKAEVILGFGTNDPRVAERAAEVYHEGLAPLIVFTGGVSSWTEGLYRSSEAEEFARIAEERGVPRESILIEGRASNTGENVVFCRALLEARGMSPGSVIVVQKPYMERRSFATFRKRWPEPEVRVTSPRLAYSEFPLPWLSRDEVIRIMVGDLHRIRVYPDKGFQIEQEIPDDVWLAFEELVGLGYGGYLVQ
ncbi:MAG: YdcF family protein [Verrucomicrobiota bacterium]